MEEEKAPDDEQSEEPAQTEPCVDVDDGDIAPEVIEHFNMIIERFKQEVSLARKQAALNQEKYQRAMADFDNFRKRVTRERAEYFDSGVRAVAEKLLPCLDNFERALSVSPDKDDILYKGVEMIYKQLNAQIKELGVEEIPALGQSFDPTLHNAIAHVDDAEYDENAIIEELQKGYKFKDKVLRASMVKVAN